MVTGAVNDYKVTDNRIAIRVGSAVSVKEGPVNVTWVHVGGGTSFALSGNRIAVYDGSCTSRKAWSVRCG
jgi:hypothetical protein